MPVGRHMRRLSLACFALAMQACTVLGPDYQEPETEWLRNWQPDLYSQESVPEGPAALDLSFWWQAFDEPGLHALIDAARRENPSLRIAGLRILEARAQFGIATANRLPQVQQLSSTATYVNSQQHGASAAGGHQDFGSYDIGINAGWELDFWGRFRRGIESADAAFFASIANQQDVQVLLSAQVADLYFSYRTVALRIAMARHNTEIQQRSLEITEQLFDSGQDSELDLQQAKTQYYSTLASVPDLEISLVNIRNTLCALLGRPPGSIPELEEAAKDLPEVQPPAIRTMQASLLMRRPDIRAAAWQVAAQSAQIGIAEADLYPSITLFGSIGWSGDSLSTTPDTTSFAAGPGLTWNLFDHGRIKNNVRVQDARLQQAIENYQNTVLLAAREIDDAAISLVKTGEERVTRAAAVEAATRSLELANDRYQEGYSDFQRVLDAQRAMFTQADREIANQGNHVSAVIAMYKALGGGWLDTPIDQLTTPDSKEAMKARADWGELLDAPLPAGTEKPAPAKRASKHE